jgi:hypothetical protein
VGEKAVKTPDDYSWLIASIEKWQRVLKLNHWRVGHRVIKAQDDVSEITFQPEYSEATINFSDTVAPEDEHIIRHELLHLVMAEMRWAVVDAIIPGLHKRNRKQAETVYKYAEERVISHLERVFEELQIERG